MDFIIRKLTKEEETPFHLFYLADPSKEAVADYLNRGTCYVGCIGAETMGVYILLPTRPFTVGLVNLAIEKTYHNKGYGKKMIQHAIETAKEAGYKILEVGAGNSSINQLALYQKCGFTITSIDFDYFRKFYLESFYENGIECRHMIRLAMDL